MEKEDKTRIQKIQIKMRKEYPELMLPRNSGITMTPELIKMYYELKMMESLKLRDTVTKVIMLLNIVVVALLGYLTYLKK